jgi:hypothetical protein
MPPFALIKDGTPSPFFLSNEPGPDGIPLVLISLLLLANLSKIFYVVTVLISTVISSKSNRQHIWIRKF